MKKEQWKAGNAIRPTRSGVAELLIIRKATGGRGADNMAVRAKRVSYWTIVMSKCLRGANRIQEDTPLAYTPIISDA